MRNNFERQYNYMNKEQNNFEDYKNQDYNYNNGKMPNNDYHPMSNDGRYNYEIRSPYQRPDYYEINRPKTMG